MSYEISYETGQRYFVTESGTAYHDRTPEAVINILEDARITRQRIRLFLGDVESGRDWGEENDVIGYVGRSTGRIKVPLLIPTSRSMGGGAILDHCIVKIMRGRRTLFEMPGYNHGKYDVLQTVTIPATDADKAAFKDGYLWKVLRDGETVARFKTNAAAERYVEFMKGERHTKGGR